MPRPHLSVSQMKTYLRCPLQWFFRYQCDLEVPPSGELVLGKAVHSALRDNYVQKIQSGRDLPCDEVTDMFCEHWSKESNGAHFSKTKSPEEMRDEGVGLLKQYMKEIAPSVEPAAVEHGFLVETGATKKPLKGYIDLIDNNGIIIDHKTTKRAFGVAAAQRDLQLTAYAMAYRAIRGKPENGVRLDVMVRNKAPKVQQLEGTRTQEDVDRFKRLARAVEEGIEKGVFYPNENFLCPSCGYGEMCGEW